MVHIIIILKQGFDSMFTNSTQMINTFLMVPSANGFGDNDGAFVNHLIIIDDSNIWDLVNGIDRGSVVGTEPEIQTVINSYGHISAWDVFVTKTYVWFISKQNYI